MLRTNTYLNAASPGVPYTAPLAPEEWPAGSASPLYRFAFMSVAGIVYGATSTDPTSPPSGIIGSGDVTVTVVYLTIGDGGSGGSFAIVDAFNEMTGQFISDTFVSDVSPAGAPAVANANQMGFVDTPADEAITALFVPKTFPGGTADDPLIFHSWGIFPGSTSDHSAAAGQVLTASAGHSPVAFAFYNAPNKAPGQKEFHKEYYKEVDKIPFDKHPWTEVPVKYVADNVIDPGDMGDPAWMQEINILRQRLAILEAGVKQGQAFIKKADRPAVGRLAKKTPSKSKPKNKRG